MNDRRFTDAVAIIAAMLALVGTALPAPAEQPDPVVIHVSPDGSDEWSGRRAEPTADGRDGPLKTLPAAQREAHKALADQGSRPVQVRIGGGVYRLGEPLVLGPADSGNAHRRIVWRNAPGEKPVLSGARKIDGWRKLGRDVEGLSDAAAEHVWVAEVSRTRDGGWRFTTLFDERGMLPRARSGPFTTRKDGPEPTRTTFPFAPGSIRDWPNLADVEVFFIPSYPWVGQYLPLASVNMDDRVARTTVPGTYELEARGRKSGTERRYWVENVPEALDEPGEWMLNTQGGRVYLWPRGDGKPADIYAPALRELIRVEGDADARDWAGNLTLRGLTFRRTQRMRWPKDRQAIQHDWQLYDFPNAMVRLRNAQGVTVEHCRFVESGGGGLRADLHAVDHRIRRNEFARLGGTGISFIGPVPGNTNPSHHNVIASNRLHRCGRLWWQSSAVMIAQSSHNRIRDNHISHMPYTGICVVSGRRGVFPPNKSGEPNDGTDGRPVRWDQIEPSPKDPMHLTGYVAARHNRIERNEIHHVMQKLGDGNGIYLSGTGWGNSVRRNYVHHVLSDGVQSAIRTDNFQYHTLIENNVVWKIDAPGFTLKFVNDMVNNIAVDCRWRGAVAVRQPPAYGANIRRNIIVQVAPESPHADVEPFFDGRWNNPRVLAQPTIDENLLWCVSEPDVARTARQKMRDEFDQSHRSIVAAPAFRDRDSGDFRIAPDSPAVRKLGFQPIRDWGTKGPIGPGDPY